MSLELTEEQGNRIAERLAYLFSAEAADALAAVDEIWPLIRDMVLDATADVCDSEARDDGTAQRCAAAIRALKGK